LAESEAFIMAKRVLQAVGAGVAVAAGAAAWLIGNAKPDTFPAVGGNRVAWPWATGIGLVVLVAPYVILALVGWMVKQIQRARFWDLVAAAGGLIVGLLIALLLTIPLSAIRFGDLNQWLPVLAALLFGYLGVAVSVLKREEIQHTIGGLFRRRRDRELGEHEEGEAGEEARPVRRGRKAALAAVEKQQEKVLLDTSAIIDGRIAEISNTGFIMGTLVVPRFVLEELQHIADSADTLRRNRGRRGLDILNRLQKESNVPVEVSDTDFDSVHEVDAKLVKMARQIHAPIITNDFNLNKVAELQGVKVLNINELANAVKPALLPGEDMFVKIIQEGKEYGQGVGYLDDGTMIVVENGKNYMNSELEVTVTRVLQTAAGRMIFAHPKSASGANVMRRSS
jgi:uncharacterized protein YacL